MAQHPADLGSRRARASKRLCGGLLGASLAWLAAGQACLTERSPRLATPSARTEEGREESAPRFAFRDATADWGLLVRHVNGAKGEHHLVETMGAGACLLDADGDSDLDLYLVASGPLDRSGGPSAANVLLRNDGGRFTDISAGSGADDPGYGMGCVAADVEGDGDTDLFVTNWGTDRLLLNDGSGHFEEADQAGVGGPPEAWSTAAVFFDADGDGLLDLFVASYVDYSLADEPACVFGDSGLRSYCEPSAYEAAPDRFFRGLGGARFEELTQLAGLTRGDGKGLGAAALDADGDSDLDLFVANDTSPNFLYVNESTPGSPRFREDGSLGGVGFDAAGHAQACMGVAIGDVDGDGSEEILVTNFALESNTLYSRGQTEWFEDVTPRSGLGPPSLRPLGFGAAFLDADLDGDLDLVVANGHVHPHVHELDAAQDHAQPDQLFENTGEGGFAEQGAGEALASPRVSRCLVTGDLDGDGLLDLVVTENGGAARLLIATGERVRGRHLLLALEQAGPNRDAIGARVLLRLADGRRVSRSVRRGDSYLGSSSPWLHFGVGSSERVDAEITWPDGLVERREQLRTGGRLRLVRAP